MPIRGLTDRPRMPRLGKIKAGYMQEHPTRKGVRYPRAADHFVVPPEVAKVYGDKPTVLEPVIIPVEDEERFASTYYRCYTASRGLVCKGDGETADRLVDLDILETTGALDPAGKDTKRVQWREVECPCAALESRDCRQVMNFQFFLPKVAGVGVWQIDTSSVHSIRNVLGCVQAIRAMCGRVSLLPLRLSLVPREVHPEGGTKKVVRVLELNVAQDITAYDLLRLRKAESAADYLLPAPDDERPEEITPDTEQRAAADEMDAQGSAPQPAGPSASEGNSAPPSRRPGLSTDMDAFFTEARKRGLDGPEALARLNVKDWNEWVRLGGTLELALKRLGAKSEAVPAS